MSPADAMLPENKSEVFNNLYEKLINKKPSRPKYKLNDRVRIAKNRLLFQKAEVQEWSPEIYK